VKVVEKSYGDYFPSTERDRLARELNDLRNTHSTLLVALDYNRRERDWLKALNLELFQMYRQRG